MRRVFVVATARLIAAGRDAATTLSCPPRVAGEDEAIVARRRRCTQVVPGEALRRRADAHASPTPSPSPLLVTMPATR